MLNEPRFLVAFAPRNDSRKVCHQLETLRATSLLDLDYAFSGAGLDLAHSRDDVTGEVEQRLGMRRAFALEDRGFAAVTGFTNVWIELDISEEGNAELLRGLLCASAGKDVDLMIAVRTDEVAHVLNHAHKVNFHLPKHFNSFSSIL